MKCIECGHNLIDKTKTYVANLENCVIIIKNVPTQVCKQCGEKSYSLDVAVRIQELVNQVKNIVSGIAEISYTDVA